MKFKFSLEELRFCHWQEPLAIILLEVVGSFCSFLRKCLQFTQRFVWNILFGTIGNSIKKQLMQVEAQLFTPGAFPWGQQNCFVLFPSQKNIK